MKIKVDFYVKLMTINPFCGWTCKKLFEYQMSLNWGSFTNDVHNFFESNCVTFFSKEGNIKKYSMDIIYEWSLNLIEIINHDDNN